MPVVAAVAEKKALVGEVADAAAVAVANARAKVQGRMHDNPCRGRLSRGSNELGRGRGSDNLDRGRTPFAY